MEFEKRKEIIFAFMQDLLTYSDLVKEIKNYNENNNEFGKKAIIEYYDDYKHKIKQYLSNNKERKKQIKELNKLFYEASQISYNNSFNLENKQESYKEFIQYCTIEKELNNDQKIIYNYFKLSEEIK